MTTPYGGRLAPATLGMDPAGAHGTEVLCGLVWSRQRGRTDSRGRPAAVAAQPAPGQREPEEATEQLRQPDGDEQEARYRHQNARNDPFDPTADIAERGERERAVVRPLGASGSSAPGPPRLPGRPARAGTRADDDRDGRRRRGSAPRRSRPGGARNARRPRRRTGAGDAAGVATGVGAGVASGAAWTPVGSAGPRRKREIGSVGSTRIGSGGRRGRGGRRRGRGGRGRARRRLRGRRFGVGVARSRLGLDRERDRHREERLARPVERSVGEMIDAAEARIGRVSDLAVLVEARMPCVVSVTRTVNSWSPSRSMSLARTPGVSMSSRFSYGAYMRRSSRSAARSGPRGARGPLAVALGMSRTRSARHASPAPRTDRTTLAMQR